LPAYGDSAPCRQAASRWSRSLQSTERSAPFRWQTPSRVSNKRRYGVDNTRHFAVSAFSATRERLSYTASRSLSSTSTKRRAFALGAVGKPDYGLRPVNRANHSYRPIRLPLKVMLSQVQRQSPALPGPATTHTLQSDNICDNGRKNKPDRHPPRNRKVFPGSVASD